MNGQYQTNHRLAEFDFLKDDRGMPGKPLAFFIFITMGLNLLYNFSNSARGGSKKEKT